MKICVTGSLVIKQIRSANGKLCVGNLHTERGIFKVKEPGQNQLTELADRCAYSEGSGHGH